MSEKKVIATQKAPQAIGPYSQAVQAGNLMFLSGQIPLNAEGNLVGETVPEQTEQVMKNIAAVLEANGLTYDDIVKTTVFLKDMGTFVQFNEVYGSFLMAPFPARACVEVSRLPKDVLVEVEAIALCSK